ncbi:MAG: type II toxin-antitoxin system VapC family toxin [Treponema sp.]|jgi:tRNA(fMet)-specific endonuclease VapC|nr:type II toxin-antitoxin system VapC family toxin [Treponema sp.]
MLDTDMISYLIRGTSEKLKNRFLKYQPEDFAVSSIVYAELAYGIKKKGSAEISAKVHQFLDQICVVDFDKICAEKYAEIRCDLESSGSIIGNADMMIAAAALATGIV